jgi:hypothetical protein
VSKGVASEGDEATSKVVRAWVFLARVAGTSVSRDADWHDEFGYDSDVCEATWVSRLLAEIDALKTQAKDVKVAKAGRRRKHAGESLREREILGSLPSVACA